VQNDKDANRGEVAAKAEKRFALADNQRTSIKANPKSVRRAKERVGRVKSTKGRNSVSSVPDIAMALLSSASVSSRAIRNKARDSRTKVMGDAYRLRNQSTRHVRD